MAKQIKPGEAPKIEAKLVNVKMPRFEVLDDMGDKQIKAANQNFTLYANTLIKTESNNLFKQYENDPIQLSNALSKIPNMLSGLPEEIQEGMKEKLYLDSVALVKKAQNNYLVEQDNKTKQQANFSVEQSRALLAESYQNVLQNAISKEEDKDFVMNDVFIEQRMNLDKLTELTDHTGKNIYSAAQIKAIKNIDDVELAGFKQFFDAMLLNDNDELEQSKKYYTEFILAPERFMADNYMNRETYDKVQAYAKKALTSAGADIKKARFNQNLKSAMELQMADLPGRIDALRQSGLINREVVDNIEKTNVKFNEIDPSKIESPMAMLDLLSIMNEQKYNAGARTEDEQVQVIAQGTATLDAIADYGKKYGLSQKTIDGMRESVVLLEANAVYRPVLNNFAEVVDNFESKMQKVRDKAKGRAWFSDITGWGMNVKEEEKLIRLNNLLSQTLATSNQQMRQGDIDGVKATQRNFQTEAAKIYYDMIDWNEAQNNPDAIFEVNGEFVRPKNIRSDGEVIFEKQK